MDLGLADGWILPPPPLVPLLPAGKLFLSNVANSMRNTEENNSILHIENILKLGREKKCAETDTVIGPVCAVCYEGVCSVL